MKHTARRLILAAIMAPAMASAQPFADHATCTYRPDNTVDSRSCAHAKFLHADTLLTAEVGTTAAKVGEAGARELKTEQNHWESVTVERCMAMARPLEERGKFFAQTAMYLCLIDLYTARTAEVREIAKAAALTRR